MRSKFAPLALTRVAGSVSDLIGLFFVRVHNEFILSIRNLYPSLPGGMRRGVIG
jgi:hypothetical protein